MEVGSGWLLSESLSRLLPAPFGQLNWCNWQCAAAVGLGSLVISSSYRLPGVGRVAIFPEVCSIEIVVMSSYAHSLDRRGAAVWLNKLTAYRLAC